MPNIRAILTHGGTSSSCKAMLWALLTPKDAVTNTSEQALQLIVGTARLSNGWDGIR